MIGNLLEEAGGTTGPGHATPASIPHAPITPTAPPIPLRSPVEVHGSNEHLNPVADPGLPPFDNNDSYEILSEKRPTKSHFALIASIACAALMLATGIAAYFYLYPSKGSTLANNATPQEDNQVENDLIESNNTSTESFTEVREAPSGETPKPNVDTHNNSPFPIQVEYGLPNYWKKGSCMTLKSL